MIQGETVAFETKKGSVKRFCPVTKYLVVFSLLRCIVIKINDSHYNHKVIWGYTAAECFFRRFAFSWNWERYHKGRLFCNKEKLCNGIAKKNQKTKCHRGIGKIVCKQTKNSQRKDQRDIDFFFFAILHGVPFSFLILKGFPIAHTLTTLTRKWRMLKRIWL